MCLKSQIHVLCNQETNFHNCWCIWAAQVFPSRAITQYFDLGNIQTTYRVPSSSYLHLVCLEINFPVSRHLLCPPFSLETLLTDFVYLWWPVNHLAKEQAADLSLEQMDFFRRTSNLEWMID